MSMPSRGVDVSGGGGVGRAAMGRGRFGGAGRSAGLTLPSTGGKGGPVAVDRHAIVRDFGQVILFTNDADIVAAERHRVYNPDEDEEEMI